MKTTLDLPEELLARLKLRAQRDGRDVQEVAARLLAAALADAGTAESSPAAAPLVAKNLPMIQVRPVERDSDPSLAAQGSSPVISTDPDTGLPVIHSPPDAPIRSMSIEEILAVEQQTLLEEDLERAGLPVRQ